MLKDILKKELLTLNVSASELMELEESMAGGVGCRGATCNGGCSGSGGSAGRTISSLELSN